MAEILQKESSDAKEIALSWLLFLTVHLLSVQTTPPLINHGSMSFHFSKIHDSVNKHTETSPKLSKSPLC